MKEIKKPFQYEKLSLESPTNQKRKRSKNTLQTVKRIWSYLAKEKAKLTLVIFLVLMSSALSLLGPYMIGMAIDDYIVTKQTDGLGLLIISLILIFLAHSLAIFFQNFSMVGIAQNTIYTLRADLFKQFHRLSISFFDKQQHGKLMSSVTNDIDNINNTLNQSVVQIIASILTLVGTVTVMLILSPLLTAITMTIIPLMFISMRWITRRTGPLYKIQQQNLGEVNGFVEEIVSGQHIVKTFSQEHRVIDEFEEKNNKLQLSNFWSLLFAGYIPKVMNMLNCLSFGLIVLFGGILVIIGHISVG